MKINKTLKETVIARLETLPPDQKISIGSWGEFTKDELIKHVKQEDSIGKKFIDIEIRFLKALKEGEFYEKTLSN